MSDGGGGGGVVSGGDPDSGGAPGMGGHRYYMGMHMGVCRGPVDELVEIRVGDRTVKMLDSPTENVSGEIIGYEPAPDYGAVTESGGAGGLPFPVPIYATPSTVRGNPVIPGGANAIRANTAVQIESADLFGGDAREGGIRGRMDVMLGGPTQTPLEALRLMVGAAAIPAWRKIFTIFYDGMICAVNPYPKTWKMRVRRTVSGWDGAVFSSGNAKIVLSGAPDPSFPDSTEEIHAMNPAHIIYECMTNREWGRGLSSAMIDVPAWQATAAQLYAEGFGMCVKWSRTDEIQNFVKGVIDTIAASLYQDRSTGKLVLKLIRNDYVFADLPLFDASTGLLAISEATFGAPGECANEVVVHWKDPVTDGDRSSRAQNLAALQSAGGAINSINRDFAGIPTADLANRVAQRELRLVSMPLRRFKLTLDRRGWQVYPGSVIRVRDVSRSIPDMALRVAHVSEAGIENGRIEVVATQDVFSLPSTAVTANQGSVWAPPTLDPCLGRIRVLEVPYFMLAANMTAADLAARTPESTFLGVLAEEGQSLNTTYTVMTHTGAPSVDEAAVDGSMFCGYTP